jgi:hypothetical protein
MKRYSMRQFVQRHSQLHHVRGITYVVKHDKWHGYWLEIDISREVMREAGWRITDKVEVEWDKCRMYLVKKPEGMYKIRFSHCSYDCHPQKLVPGRFVGVVKCSWKPEYMLPRVSPRVYCDDIRVGKSSVSFRLPCGRKR